MNNGEEEHIIIRPRKGRKERSIPENGLLLVNPTEATKCLDALREGGADSRYLFNSRLAVSEEPPFFVAGPAIGAPMAAMTMEKLIVLGAKRIILFGWCGAISSKLKIGDVLVPDSAESGEGTSSYYPHDQPAGPGRRFSEQVGAILAENNLVVHRGRVWSTDAIYREDRLILTELNTRRKVVAVDMEFSALCAVARFRDIEFCAVLTVSDELWGASWRPGFTTDSFHRQKSAALDVLLKNISTFAGN